MATRIGRLVIAGLSVCIVASSSAAALPISASAGSIAESLRAQYAQIHSVHLRANYTLTFEGSGGSSKSYTATLEYWASGDRFRLASSVDPELAGAGFMGGQVIAFDGSESRVLTNAGQTLIISGGEVADSSVVPNPLFVPLSFLRVQSRACSDCRPSLADVRRMSTTSLAAQERSLVTLLSGRPGAAQLSLFGASFQDDVKAVQLAQMGSSWSPTGSVTRGYDGSIRERNTFEDAQVVPGTGPELFVSRHQILENWMDGSDMPNGATALRVEITITDLEVNQAIEDSVFTIPDSLGTTVIDEDTHQVLRAPECEKISGKAHD